MKKCKVKFVEATIQRITILFSKNEDINKATLKMSAKVAQKAKSPLRGTLLTLPLPPTTITNIGRI